MFPPPGARRADEIPGHDVWKRPDVAAGGRGRDRASIPGEATRTHGREKIKLFCLLLIFTIADFRERE